MEVFKTLVITIIWREVTSARILHSDAEKIMFDGRSKSGCDGVIIKIKRANEQDTEPHLHGKLPLKIWLDLNFAMECMRHLAIQYQLPEAVSYTEGVGGRCWILFPAKFPPGGLESMLKTVDQVFQLLCGTS